MKLNRVLEKFDLLRDIPISYEGKKYSAVSHDTVYDTMTEFIDKSSMEIKKESFLSDSKGEKIIGIFSFGSIDPTMEFSLAWRNSIDGTRSFSVVAGSMVSVCSNTNIWGDMSVFKRKHIGDAKTEIIESLKRSLDSFDKVQKDHILIKEKAVNYTLDEVIRLASISDMFVHKNIFDSEQLNTLKKEILEPTYIYEDPNSMWDFYNKCTFALKKTHPSSFIEKHQQLSNFLLSEFL